MGVSEMLSDQTKKNMKLMIPIGLFAIFDSAFTSFSPILSRISEVFPEVSTTVIQLILTLPTLTLIPASLLAGFLASYITKKTIANISLIIMLIGGLIPLFIHSNVYILFVSSGLVGVGQGFIKPLASSLVCEYFDGRSRGMYLGFKQAANYLGAAALTMLIGFLSMFAWYNVYWLYLLVIPVIILTNMFMPKTNLEVKLISKKTGLLGMKKVFTPAFIYMCLIITVLAALQFAFYTNISMLVVEKGLGDSADAAKVTSLNFVLSLGIALSFGLLLKLFKKYTLAIGLLILSSSFFILYLSNSITMAIIAGMIFGIGGSFQEIGTVYYITESISKSVATMAISIAMVFISLGITVSPIIVNGLQRIFFNEVTSTGSMIIAAYGYLVLFVIELIREIVFNKNSNIGQLATNKSKETEKEMKSV